jgi:hypothetical protein
MYILVKQGAAGKPEIFGQAHNPDKLKRLVYSKTQPNVGSWTVYPNDHHINGNWYIIPKKK